VPAWIATVSPAVTASAAGWIVCHGAASVPAAVSAVRLTFAQALRCFHADTHDWRLHEARSAMTWLAITPYSPDREDRDLQTPYRATR